MTKIRIGSQIIANGKWYVVTGMENADPPCNPLNTNDLQHGTIYATDQDGGERQIHPATIQNVDNTYLETTI